MSERPLEIAMGLELTVGGQPLPTDAHRHPTGATSPVPGTQPEVLIPFARPGLNMVSTSKERRKQAVEAHPVALWAARVTWGRLARRRPAPGAP